MDEFPNMIYSFNIAIASTKVAHSREVYNTLDLIGDLGGVLEVISLVFAVFLVPFSEHSFVLKAL